MTFAIQFSTPPAAGGAATLTFAGRRSRSFRRYPFWSTSRIGARLGVPRLLPDDRLVHVGIERKPERGHLGQPVPPEDVSELLRDHLDPDVDVGARRGVSVHEVAERPLEVVEDAEKLGEDLHERVPEVLALLAFRPSLQVLEVGGLPEKGFPQPAGLLLLGQKPLLRSGELRRDFAELLVDRRSLRRRGGDPGGGRPFLDASMLPRGGRDGPLGLGERLRQVLGAIVLDVDDPVVRGRRGLRRLLHDPHSSVSRDVTKRPSSSTIGTTCSYSIRRGPMIPRTPSACSPHR